MGLLQLAKHQGPPTAHREPPRSRHTGEFPNQLFQQPATRLSDRASWALACELQHLEGSSQQAERCGGQGQRVL